MGRGNSYFMDCIRRSKAVVIMANCNIEPISDCKSLDEFEKLYLLCHDKTQLTNVYREWIGDIEKIHKCL